MRQLACLTGAAPPHDTPAVTTMNPHPGGTRLRVAFLSIGAGLVILGLKAWAAWLSGSAALKSDAIESVVNVVAAVFALGAVLFAEQPADKKHPYGHGKIEHFSAAFEGGLIALAAVIIAWEACLALLRQWQGTDTLTDSLGLGLIMNLVAGALNGALGWFLVRMGRRQRSRALEADGHHVLSDFWTTLGIGVGVGLVMLTGLKWLDPLLALVVAGLLASTGYRLVRDSSDALLDREDPVLLAALVDAFNRVRPPDVIAVHELRTLRAGRYTHVDIHLVIPEYYDVLRGHDLADVFCRRVLDATGMEGELHTHVDPCERRWCRQCAVEACGVRREPQAETVPLTLERATDPGTI